MSIATHPDASSSDARRRHFSPGLADFLDSLEGIAYAVDLAGHLMAVGRTHWAAFAERAAAPEVATPTRLLGTPLLDIVQGDEVRAVYRDALARVVGQDRTIVLATRCDSPDTKRELRLAMTPLRTEKGIQGVVFHAQTVSETSRPPLPIYDFKTIAATLAGLQALPIVTMCSFCQRIRLGDASAGNWVSAEEYYRRGGVTEVRISHGLCHACRDTHYGA